MTITTRSGKGSALTWDELDANFDDLGSRPSGAVPSGTGFVRVTDGVVATPAELSGDLSTAGLVATIGAAAVSLAKMADMATASLIYRKTAGAGVPEVNTLATLKTDLGLTGTNSGDNAANSLYSGLVSNATHTGDVTGSTALTLATAQPGAHTWAAAQTFTVAPVFTDAPGSRTALGLGTLATQSGTFSGANTGDDAVNSLYSGLVSNATHTGDATGATALTLATVNADVGSFTNANVTVNAKGLVTAAANGAAGASGANLAEAAYMGAL